MDPMTYIFVGFRTFNTENYYLLKQHVGFFVHFDSAMTVVGGGGERPQAELFRGRHRELCTGFHLLLDIYALHTP